MLIFVTEVTKLIVSTKIVGSGTSLTKTAGSGTSATGTTGLVTGTCSDGNISPRYRFVYDFPGTEEIYNVITIFNRQ